jgi:hypothetical protein
MAIMIRRLFLWGLDGFLWTSGFRMWGLDKSKWGEWSTHSRVHGHATQGIRMLRLDGSELCKWSVDQEN